VSLKSCVFYIIPVREAAMGVTYKTSKKIEPKIPDVLTAELTRATEKAVVLKETQVPPHTLEGWLSACKRWYWLPVNMVLTPVHIARAVYWLWKLRKQGEPSE